MNELPIAAALARIAKALNRLAEVEEKRYSKEYPDPKVKEAFVGTARYRKPRPSAEEESKTADDRSRPSDSHR